MRRTKKPVEVESITHVSDTRKNIPTEELRDFVAEDEHNPPNSLYPRNPDLDPQLVWQGKDEQDSADLEVPVVPIYIQEKIHPHAIIEDIRRQAKQTAQKQGETTLDLFADFNGIDFEQQLEFYQHNQKWQNRMILGDSLFVMTSLAEKEGLKGQVQMIYLDPPYGIKFGSNWQVSTRKRDVKDGKVEDVTRQPEQVKAFRDTWKLGIHSYLAYLRDRLAAARELLTDSGSVFVQIGDENVHLVRCLLDEVFGSENFVALILFRKTGGLQTNLLASVGDYLLWYAKDFSNLKYRQLYLTKKPGQSGASQYKYTLRDGELIELSPEELQVTNSSELLTHDNLTSQGNPIIEFKFQGKIFRSNFKPPIPSLQRLAVTGRLFPIGNTLRYLRSLSDFPVFEINELWEDVGTSGFSEKKIYVVQTNPSVIERCLLMTTDPGDLVLDPTCGSGTTAYMAEQWGRRWITCDTSRVALALARTRLMAAKYPYYLLADSSDGLKKEAECTGKVPENLHTGGDIKKGFVYKRVPHITLKSIANNVEIDVLHAQYQAQLEPLRARLNELLRQNWEEWEIPRHANDDWSQATKDTLAQWWELRQQRQQAIDAAIARNADTETLFDQPVEDNKKIRVTGPFTVESLSPHRVLSTDIDQPQSEQAARAESAGGDFTTLLLENLRKAGVQNTIKNERLKFDSLDPYSGRWIQAEGRYTEQDGAARRAAISIGPEHGAVSPQQVKEACKEAVQGLGFDVLLVCGLAFDPHVSEEARRYGKLVVLPVRVNPDLVMGGDLLKKTGSGNLFMIFGEPDLEIRRTKDGKVQVELLGLDIYDPTTGQIRSNSTREIACWFIDTNYNEESFFVRHAYFTGGDEPYDKLKRALKAEIDEAAWSQLYSTVSRPFDSPESGKIAVKVINHYGDEVLKVFAV
ncbi:DNA methylase [Candidatus Vecturithrix granuli]|uniref:DNA methylase n=1 Tax=Vecturithrix granuli TaxID=1499967 RepID=A0A081C7P5_VECG1|nr:DNA methylase [Candidatus Vecturithrix granuli]